jgi:hypothetical protein
MHIAVSGEVDLADAAAVEDQIQLAVSHPPCHSTRSPAGSSSYPDSNHSLRSNPKAKDSRTVVVIVLD